MDWSRGRLIGRGAYATVSIATSHWSSRAFAVKSVELSQSELLRKEQSFLSSFKCPQIIAYRGCDITNENGKLLYNLFLEYAPGGTLIDAIRHHGGRLDESMIRSHTRAVLLGLEYLHSNGIVHCDIKGHNILVTGDGAKIADFGCARRINEVPRANWATMTPIAGTPLYMAPEVARGEYQGFPADIWALGCTTIEMGSGQPPWVDVSEPVSALYQIGFSSNVPEIPSFMSKEAKDFISKCLKRDPKERWSASELLKHPFIVEEPNISNFNVDTPTSVLNQCLWNSTTELLMIQNCPSDSPVDRIMQLSEGNRDEPDWAWEDTWITVRSNNSSKQEETCVRGEDYGLVYANEPTNINISGMNTPNTSISCCNHTHELLILNPCKCAKDAFDHDKEIDFSSLASQFLFNFH